VARCPYVKPDVERYPLAEGDWIEFKKYLNAGESKALAGAGVPSMTPGEKGPKSFELDFRALGLSRLHAYATAWSFVDFKGNQTKPTLDDIAQLDPEVFDELDKVLDGHIKEMAARKNSPTSVEPGATS
jgi:hypothetical protein